MANQAEDEEEEDLKVLMWMHPIQPTFISNGKHQSKTKNKSLAMQKLDANEKYSPHMFEGEKEETLYSVPLKAEKDLIKSPKGLRF